METIWINWQALEARIPLSELPHFHRVVLSRLYPNEKWEATLLREAQERLQAAVSQLKRDSLAYQGQGGLWVASIVVPETFRGYLP